MPSGVHRGCLHRAAGWPPASSCAPAGASESPETTVLGVEAGQRLRDCAAFSPSVAPLGGETSFWFLEMYFYYLNGIKLQNGIQWNLPCLIHVEYITAFQKVVFKKVFDLPHGEWVILNSVSFHFDFINNK